MNNEEDGTKNKREKNAIKKDLLNIILQRLPEKKRESSQASSMFQRGFSLPLLNQQTAIEINQNE